MYQLNSLLRFMAIMAQLQQMHQLSFSMNQGSPPPGVASSQDVTEETRALAREQLRLTPGESYKAYGELPSHGPRTLRREILELIQGQPA